MYRPRPALEELPAIYESDSRGVDATVYGRWLRRLAAVVVEAAVGKEGEAAGLLVVTTKVPSLPLFSLFDCPVVVFGNVKVPTDRARPHGGRGLLRSTGSTRMKAVQGEPGLESAWFQLLKP